ncbi:hypothetical protein H310_05826 [Aphanomyces invadans]|uniref:RNase III domain-containing protein n=1 Tax=Aphanomyces invadans TaxID=157072 RepID=A0A024U8S2_9STRA|nr:hypothetical protein H310_05826 [Aphanomyces invadans]ETW02277.1 hypothetical protein H310_05826 [Aphanomyces invadans]|eukprot:XP_008868882.1 hypothetical protein H310_05826 [Aphanomyces invadans]
MDYMVASSKCTAEMFLAEYPPESLLHHVVAYEDGANHVGCFRVDIATSQPQLLHDGLGAKPLEGVTDPRRVKAWQEIGPLVSESPQVPSTMKVLHPNVSYLTGLKCDVLEIASALPLIFRFLRHCIQLDEFEARWQLEFDDKCLLRQAFTHVSSIDCGVQHANTLEGVVGRVQLGHTFRTNTLSPLNGPPKCTTAHTSPATPIQPNASSYSHYLCPYDRLKFLGDAVLTFVVSSNIFCQFPDVSEGHLHDLRTKIVTNDTVGDLAKTCQLDQLILTSFDLATVDEDVSNAVAADCVKAILGAIIYEQGWARGVVSARAFLKQLFVVYDAELADFMFLLSQDLAAKVQRELDGQHKSFQEHAEASQMRGRHKQFLATCPIRMDRPHLWLQMMTHKSLNGSAASGGKAKVGYRGDGNCGRLAFLGDSVLQVVASRDLMDMVPYHQEALLSTVRTSLLSKARLAEVGAAMNLLPVVADVFVASLGAMYLEQLSLQDVEHVLHARLFVLVPAVVADRDGLGPKQRFLHHVRQWPQQCRVTLLTSWTVAEASTCTQSRCQWTDTSFVVPTKDLAANSAATKAMRLFGV